MFEEQKQQWKELDPKMKAMFAVIIIVGTVFIAIQHQKNKAAETLAEQKRLEKAAQEESNKKPGESKVR